MREHLRFLFKHRKTLRLKVNASEDLLLNGAKAPTHRGACLHLLSKVDLSSVESTLTRLPDPAERVELLAGVVRFSTDAGVLLLWLESLAGVASRTQAAAAFDRAVRRIDFSRISPARMRRVLDLVARTFEGHERVQVLFNLLRSQGFRDAFDASAEKLPDELAGLFVPLRAVHETILEGRPDRFGADVLGEGVAAVLTAPEAVLRSYAEPVRERLLESAVRLLRDAATADRAEEVLLDSLPKEGRSYSRIGLLRAAELLRRHDDALARALLTRICATHPGFHKPARWLEALDAPRVGRLALIGRDEGRLRFAFWLDGQHPAWVRTAVGSDGVSALEEARWQRDALVAGVAPVVLSGVGDDGVAHVAFPAMGRPADLVLRRKPSRPLAVLVATQAAQVLASLAMAGKTLPDAAPSRFLLSEGEQPLLWLADLTGLAPAAPSEAARRHLALAVAWTEEILALVPARDVSPVFLSRMRASRDLAELVGLLAAEA